MRQHAHKKPRIKPLVTDRGQAGRDPTRPRGQELRVHAQAIVLQHLGKGLTAMKLLLPAQTLRRVMCQSLAVLQAGVQHTTLFQHLAHSGHIQARGSGH